MGCNWEWDSWSGVMAGMQKWALCLGEGEGCGMGCYLEWDSGSGVMAGSWH